MMSEESGLDYKALFSWSWAIWKHINTYCELEVELDEVLSKPFVSDTDIGPFVSIPLELWLSLGNSAVFGPAL